MCDTAPPASPVQSPESRRRSEGPVRNIVSCIEFICILKLYLKSDGKFKI